MTTDFSGLGYSKHRLQIPRIPEFSLLSSSASSPMASSVAVDMLDALDDIPAAHVSPFRIPRLRQSRISGWFRVSFDTQYVLCLVSSIV